MARSFLTSTLSSDESLTPPSSSDEGQGLHSPIYHRKKSTPKQRPFSPSSLSSTGNEDCHDDLEHGAWNTNYAVVYLINHLRNSSSKVDDKVTSAARAITLARNYPVPARQWRRYPGLIFPALSDAVFDSKLSDEQGVKVEWGRMDEGVSGRTVLLGQEVKIELNATALRSANRDEIVGTLLHHMIHAYLLVVCSGNDGDLAYCHEEEDRDGWEEGDQNDDYDHLAHGHAFAAILWEIRSQAAKGETDGERPLPIGFGHRLPSAFSKFMTDRAAASCASASTLSSKSTGSMSSTSVIKSTKKGSNATIHSPRHPRNCSHCPACVPTISLDASETWYTAECAPFLSAPTLRRSSTSSYVELILSGDKPIRIPRGSVEQFASLAALFSNGKRWIELSRADIGRKELGALMSFLKTRSYQPVLKPKEDGREGRGDGCGRVGGAWTSPPIIKARARDKRTRKHSHIAASDGDEDGEPEPTAHLFHDIRVYHLARALGFAELAAHSLREESKGMRCWRM
ncbi:hypothetical protein GTA08_BOTSDO04329 [Neofusicoccum parvum]|uniref:Uncharacterized protein n=1 Tax=Neofusicoccum parvum TaxID=310453 RepID=A0ACB5S7P6_9PEZI|nr:hypothetical protein GTA08_BOTSDO04329 [Neofusicoccum parvum]